MLLNNYLIFQEILKIADFGSDNIGTSANGANFKNKSLELKNFIKDCKGDEYNIVNYGSYYDYSQCVLTSALHYCNKFFNNKALLISDTYKLNDNYESSNNYGTMEIIIGSGTDTPVISDYKLSNKIPLNSYKFESNNLFYEVDTTNKIIKHKLMQGFIALNDITINEFGIVGKLNLGSSKLMKSTLFTRDVLDEPLIVPANTHFELSIEICEPY